MLGLVLCGFGSVNSVGWLGDVPLGSECFCIGFR